MKSLLKSTLLFGMGTAMAASSAMGAFTFTNGDLILGIQAASGTGSDKNVFFNLGSGTYHRDNPGYNFGVATNGNNPFGTVGQTEIGNIGATLTLAFGSDWYSRSDLYFGVVANLNQQPNTGGFGSRQPVNGDPSRTFYLSTPTTIIGAGALYAPNTFPAAAMGTGGTNLSGLEGFLPGLTTESDGAAVLDKTAQPVQWNNSWTAWNPTPGAAFSVFTGGIQQHFGQGTAETYVDLQRVLAYAAGADPTGVVGGGTYETSFAIASDGSVFSIPEPSAAVLGGLGLLALLRRRRA
jgi:hypothetical protein